MTDLTQYKTITLPRGTLTLAYQTTGDYQLDDLLGFAERINPKRAFLFVSKVLGRHIPVAPSQMRNAFSDLANLIPNNLPEPIVVIGMAETAVGLSAGVHQTLQSRYPNAILLNSTRHTQNGTLLTTFSEDHSHASTHLIYQSDDSELQQQVLNAKTLIMVDDEASTGQTCQNVVNALRHAGLTQLEQVHLATLVDWSLGKVENQPFKDIAFFRHHLLSGSWQWTDIPNAKPITMPKVDSVEAGNQPLLATGDWGRKPTICTDLGLNLLWQNLEKLLPSFCKGGVGGGLNDKKILVLGSNEFVWLPFLLAEKLENLLKNQNSSIKFGSLTRSPIATNDTDETAIKAVIKFADNYGLGMTNFVYNVVPSDWNLIVLCIETPKASVDKVWQNFDNVIVVTPDSGMLETLYLLSSPANAKSLERAIAQHKALKSKEN